MAKTWRCPICAQDKELAPDLSAAHAQTLRRLAYLLRGLSPQQFTQRPREGEWSIHEVVCHMADAEVVWGFRYRKGMTEERLEVPLYDQNRFASNLAYLKRDLSTAREGFNALRRANADMLRSVDDRYLQSPVQHPVHGAMTVYLLAQHVLHHDGIHLRQIKEAREAITGGKR